MCDPIIFEHGQHKLDSVSHFKKEKDVKLGGQDGESAGGVEG